MRIAIYPRHAFAAEMCVVEAGHCTRKRAAKRKNFNHTYLMKNENDKLFPEFKEATYQEWHAEAVKLLKGAPFDKKMLTNTPEKITLRPIYNREDVDFEISLPGTGDYVRGTKIDGDKIEPWKISQELSAGLPEEFNAKILDALNKGQTAVEIVLDKPSGCGVDADKADKSAVARGGLSVSSAKDFSRALDGVETGCVEISIHTGCKAAAIAAMLYASQKGKKLSGGIYFDPIGQLAKNGKICRTLDCAYDEMFELASYNAANMPEFGAIGIDTMPYSSAGASAAEELGAAMATAVAYIRQMLKRSMKIDDIAKLVRFRFSLGSNFFMEIAKLRAARKLWSKIISEFGGSDESRKIRVNARTAFFNKTVYDPYVNMLRTTTEAFSGAIGGCDSMTVGAFDEIIRRPDEFSERIARNQQIILQEECELTDVIDPAGGSYFVEVLTKELAEKAWEFFAKIEAKGGMAAALESGEVQAEIAATAAGRKKLYDTRRSSVVGTNNYANKLEKPLEKSADYSDEAIEKRVKQVAADRVDAEAATGGKAEGSKMAEAVAAAEKGASLAALAQIFCGCGGAETSVPALGIHRAVEHYEALRAASEKFKAEKGFAPKLFLATMGPLLQHKARADFIRGFFEVGGFDVIYPNGFQTPEEAAKAFAESGAKYAVICSTDDTYPELVPAVTKALKAAVPDSTVFMAGAPAPEAEPSYKQAGCDGAISIKSNNYETLKGILAALNVL